MKGSFPRDLGWKGNGYFRIWIHPKTNGNIFKIFAVIYR